MNAIRIRVAALLAVCCLAFFLVETGPEPLQFFEKEDGKASVRIVDGLPILTLEGSYREMGQQYGRLMGKQGIRLLEYFKGIIQDRGLNGNSWINAYYVAQGMKEHLPPNQLEEMKGFAETSGYDFGTTLAIFVTADIAYKMGCSTVIVEPERSATGQLFFGRNHDTALHDEWVQRGTIVGVRRSKEKRGYVEVTYPGIIGCFQGMNDAGLCLTTNDASGWADGSPPFDPRGLPRIIACRKILEECATVDEAVEMFRSFKNCTVHLVTICDKKRGIVLEVSPKTVAVRPTQGGYAGCTNHYRTGKLAIPEEANCPRYARLETEAKKLDKMSFDDVAHLLHYVNFTDGPYRPIRQGTKSVQTIIFEPGNMLMHVAKDKGPKMEFVKLDVRELLGL